MPVHHLPSRILSLK